MYHSYSNQSVGGSANPMLSPHRPMSHARTPGPMLGGSRHHASSRRNVPATVASKGSVKDLAESQSSTLVSPKQLFGDLKRTVGTGNKVPAQTPGRRAFGEKNVANTPGTGIRQQRRTPSSAAKSPTKRASDSEKPLLSKGKSIEHPTSTPAPSKANQSYTTATPAPSQARGSRKQPFVTPAANIGQAGLIRQRLADELDAQNGISHSPAAAPEIQLTDEEMYPEIEYMPSSEWAKNPPYYFPDEMEDSPRAANLGAELRKNFRCVGFEKGGSWDITFEEMEQAEAYNREALELGALERKRLSASLRQDLPDFQEEFWPDIWVSPAPSTTVSGPASHSITRPTTRTAPAGAPPGRLVVPARPAPKLAATTRVPVSGAHPIRSATRNSAPISSASVSRPSAISSTVRRPPGSTNGAVGGFSSRTDKAPFRAGVSISGVAASRSAAAGPAKPLRSVTSKAPLPSRSGAVPVAGARGRSSAPFKATANGVRISPAPALVRRRNPALEEFYKDSLGLLVEEQLRKLSKLDEPEGFVLDEES